MHKYHLITKTLKDRIQAGQYKRGEKIPSMNDLREEFDASYGSIRTSLIILKVEGLVEGRHGIGVFVK